MNVDTFTAILAEWLRTKFLPAIFPKKSFVGFMGGAFSKVIALKMTNTILPLFANGDMELDEKKLREMAADGFAVSDVIPFEITPALIPEQFRPFVAPLLFDEAHPTIKCELTKEDVDDLISLFAPKTVKREVKL